MKRYKVTRDMKDKEATLKTLKGFTREYHEGQGHTCYYFDTWNEEAHDIFTRCVNDDTVLPLLVQGVDGKWKESEEHFGNLINFSHGNYYICISNVKTLEMFYFLFDTIEETEIAWDYYVKYGRSIYVAVYDEELKACFYRKRGEVKNEDIY